MLQLAERYDFPYWRAWGRALAGWARAMRDDPEAGLRDCRAALTAYRATGAELMCPYFLGLAAEAALRAGRLDEGLAAADEAIARAEAGHIRFFEPEIQRIRACLLAASGATGAQLASLASAITTAQAQGSKLFELRSQTALCRADIPPAKKREALERIATLLEPFDDLQQDEPISEARKLRQSAKS